jgi:hypothetical protein
MFDTLATTRMTLESLAGDFDPDALSGAQAVRVVTMLGVIHRLTEGLLATAAKRVDETAAFVRDGHRDAAQFYAKAVGVDASEARRVLVLAERLERLPMTASAVREGRLSGRQAQMIAGAATRNPAAEPRLLAAAGSGMVPLRDACIAARAEVDDPKDRAARQHAGRKLRTWTGNSGMFEGRFSLTPEIGGQIKAVLDAETQRIFRDHRTTGRHELHEAYGADALANLLLGGEAEGSATKRRAGPSVHVVIDHEALVRGNAVKGERCEIPGVGPVNAQWVREHLGEAFLTAVIKQGRDIRTVAHLGRHVPAEVRTAMIVGGRECEVVGCHSRGYLERDHCEVDFANGGPTAWWNLAWLCSVHHRRKTRGWILGAAEPLSGKRTLRAPEPAVVSRR